MSRAVLALAGLGLTAIAAPADLRPAPRWLWNASASAPLGLYRLEPGRTGEVRDWVAAWPPANLAPLFAARRYLPLGVPLVKRVAAVSPAVVCRFSDAISIDGRLAVVAREVDHLGRALPAWRGCRQLAAHEVFLLNPAPDSLDSRYFGPLPAANLIGRLTPVWTWSDPHLAQRERSSSTTDSPVKAMAAPRADGAAGSSPAPKAAARSGRLEAAASFDQPQRRLSDLRLIAFTVALLWSTGSNASAQPTLSFRGLPGDRGAVFGEIIAEASQRFGVPAPWIAAVMRAESAFNPRATSPKGAMGLMQLMPQTWATMRAELGLGGDPYDPHDNVLAGVGYLRALYDRFGRAGFLAAYNAGPERYLEGLVNGRPLPPATRQYVAAITPRLGDVGAVAAPRLVRPPTVFIRTASHAIAPSDPSVGASAGGAERNPGPLSPAPNGLFAPAWGRPRP